MAIYVGWSILNKTTRPRHQSREKVLCKFGWRSPTDEMEGAGDWFRVCMQPFFRRKERFWLQIMWSREWQGDRQLDSKTKKMI